MHRMLYLTGLLVTAIALFDSNLACAATPNTKYYDGLAANTADAQHLLTMGPMYLSELMNGLAFSYPAKTGARQPQFFDEVMIHQSLIHAMSPSVCRMTDYLAKCLHGYDDLREEGNDNTGSDDHGPFVLDIALTDEPVEESVYTEYPDLQYFPAISTCAVPVHSVAGFTQSDPLILDRQVLARIFRGNITVWDHADIVASNPGHASDLHAAGNIKLVLFEEWSVLTRLFKSALAHFDPEFESQIGVSGDSDWEGVEAKNPNVMFREGDTAVASHLTFFPGSIGYSALYEANQFELKKVSLLVEGSTTERVDCNQESIGFAASDKGFDFGRDGRNPARFVADIDSSNHRFAWPISTYVYIALRLDTMRAGATCSTRQDVTRFLNWFYKNEEASRLIARFDYAPLPQSIRNFMINEINTRYKCNGNLVHDPFEDMSLIPLHGISVIKPVIDSLDSAFQSKYPNIVVESGIDRAALIHEIDTSSMMEGGIDHGFVGLVRQSDTQTMTKIDKNKNLQIFPYSAVAMGIMTNLCGSEHLEACDLSETELNMDLMTLSKILDGDIEFWDDPQILALNPEWSSVLPHESIVVVRASEDEFATHFIDVLRQVNPSFLFKGASINVNTFLQTESYVYEHAYTVAMIPLVGRPESMANLMRIKNNQGSFALPSRLSVEACGKDTFDDAAMRFSLASSKEAGCYPLVDEIYVVSPVLYSVCTKHNTATASFLQWMINGNGKVAHDHDIIHHPIRNESLNIDASVNVELALKANNFGQLFYIDVVGNGYRSDGNTLRIRMVEQLERMKCNGTQMLMKHPELGLIPEELKQVVWVLASICIAVIAGLGVWIFLNRKKKLIRNSSPLFMSQILFGSFLSISAIFLMGIQDSNFNFHDHSFNEDWTSFHLACQATPFLYSVGFGVSFSALFVKTYRMVKLFNNRKFKRLRITDWMLVKYQVAIVGSIVVFNVGWLIIDPLMWMRVPVAISETGDVIVSSGICGMRTNVYYAITPMILFMVTALIGGNYLSYKGRFIPSEFAESKWVGFSMVLYLEALLFGVPLIILTANNSGANYLVKSFSIILGDFGTVMLIFVPKIWLLYGWGVEGQSSMNKEGSSSGEGSSSKATTKKGGSRNTNSRENVTVYPGGLGSSGSVADMRHLSSSGGVQSSASLDGHGHGHGQNGSSPAHKMKTNGSQIQINVVKNKGNLTSIPANEVAVEAFSVVYRSIEQCLESEDARNGLIDYAAPKMMDEPIRFYSDVVEFQKTKSPKFKIKRALEIIRKYILSESPLELSLPSPLRSKYERVMLQYESDADAADEAGGGRKNQTNWFLRLFSSGGNGKTNRVDTLHEQQRMRAQSQRVNQVEQGSPSLMQSALTRGASVKSSHSPSNTPESARVGGGVVSATDQLLDSEFFRPVQKLVCFEMQADRKRWRAVIRFLDAPRAANGFALEQTTESDQEQQQQQQEPPKQQPQQQQKPQQQETCSAASLT